MTLTDHAREELKRAGMFDEDSDYDGMLGTAVMELVEKFSGQGHSGYSAMMTIDLFSRVARYEPLVPLTGDDDEWDDVSGIGGGETGPLWQNKRCSSVFKDDTRAWTVDVVKHYPNGETTTGPPEGGWPTILFPYVPETIHVHVEHDPDE